MFTCIIFNYFRLMLLEDSIKFGFGFLHLQLEYIHQITQRTVFIHLVHIKMRIIMSYLVLWNWKTVPVRSYMEKTSLIWISWFWRQSTPLSLESGWQFNEVYVMFNYIEDLQLPYLCTPPYFKSLGTFLIALNKPAYHQVSL